MARDEYGKVIAVKNLAQVQRDALQYAINARVDLATGDMDGDDTTEFLLEFILTHPDKEDMYELLDEFREWNAEVTVEDFVDEGGGE